MIRNLPTSYKRGAELSILHYALHEAPTGLTASLRSQLATTRLAFLLMTVQSPVALMLPPDHGRMSRKVEFAYRMSTSKVGGALGGRKDDGPDGATHEGPRQDPDLGGPGEVRVWERQPGDEQ